MTAPSKLYARLTAGLSIALALALPPTAANAQDRQHEGDWYVSDTTDNNTGEREVYGFVLHLKSGDPDFVTLKLRCSKGEPSLFIEWGDVVFPDQVVISVTNSAEHTPDEITKKFVFEKSDEVLEPGIKADTKSTSEIISLIGNSAFATFTAHLPYSSRRVAMDVIGSEGAWSRVQRHCPVRKMPLPPV